MGFQVTLLLATFFYVDYFQANMPTFSGLFFMNFMNVDTIFGLYHELVTTYGVYSHQDDTIVCSIAYAGFMKNS